MRFWLLLFLQDRDLLAPITSGTATSVMGWGGFLFGLIACVILLWDRVVGRGKAEQKVSASLQGLCEQVEALEAQLVIVNGLTKSVGELVYEWRGFDGSNGYKSIIKEHDRLIIEIQRRNDRLDAVRDEDERRSGGQQRRQIDRELNDLLPKKREGER